MSMYPFIRDGDILTLGRENHFREGDVYAFPHPQTGGLVVHRLVKRRNRLLMKGDHNSLPDGWLAREQILARLIRVERDGCVVQPAHHGVRRLIALISISRGVRWCRWSILKRLNKLGDFY